MLRNSFLSRWFSSQSCRLPTSLRTSRSSQPTSAAMSLPASSCPTLVSASAHSKASTKATTPDSQLTSRKEPRLRLPCDPVLSTQPASTGIGPRALAETLRPQSHMGQADIFRPYQPPKGVRGDGRTHLVMDSAAATNPGLLGWLRQAVAEGVAFPGYPRLAEMSQRAEYRHMVEVIAAEATREWITFRARGTADKKQRLADLERDFLRLNVRDVLRRMAEYDGYYGMGLLYVDTGQPRTGGALETPLLLRPETFRKGSLRALVPIEPVWTTPDQYDTTNPLSAEFYQPSRWWVQGGLLHSTRLLQFVSRPVPDLLKPAYNFGGLSLSQMARPAVDNWLRTRQSVSDLLNAFSIVALSTDMSAYAQDPEGLLSRVEAFNRFRSNRGTFVLDKDREKLELLAAPLAGLDRLQAQAQEQMCAVAQEPLVKFTGITPSGLNASADGEIRVFYDRVHAFQETFYRRNLTTILHMVMLNLWGEIDPDIDFTFVSLWQMDELARATLQKTRADIDAQNIRSGIITPTEARSRTAHDAGGQYAAVNLAGTPPAA
ncbi:DUF1073 domain-containing protein [Acetobacter orleanensis]|nr:DUF1073 domain-containing protein [Acetobacter orleanensis]